MEKFGFLLHDAARALRRRFEMRGSALGLSSAQWRLLARLIRFGPSTQARLADMLEIEPISVSRLVDRMEEAGWVARRPDENDRRVRIVVPTQQAMEAFADIQHVVAEVYDEALAGLSQSERLALVHALETIVTNIADAADTATCGTSAKATQ